MQDSDVIYAAGVFDVCGSIFFRRNARIKSKNIYIRIKASGKKIGAIEQIQKTFGGSISTAEKFKNGVVRYKEYVATCYIAREFLKAIQPYLKTNRKQQMVKLALEYPISETGHRATDELRALQEQFEKQMKVLVKQKFRKDLVMPY